MHAPVQTHSLVRGVGVVVMLVGLAQWVVVHVATAISTIAGELEAPRLAEQVSDTKSACNSLLLP